MRVIETKVYTFRELSDTAKQTAREWWNSIPDDGYDTEFVYEDAATIADLFGLDIRTRLVRTLDKSVRYDPCIYYSGFWSQGDGACFEGTYRYKKGALAQVKKYVPTDTRLHRIVKGLQDIQRRFFYKLEARTRHRGHYYHSYCMDVSVESSAYNIPCTPEAEDEVTELLRNFADWIYDRLYEEYTWRHEDEQVDELLIINGYEFTENGEIA